MSKESVDPQVSEKSFVEGLRPIGGPTCRQCPYDWKNCFVTGPPIDRRQNSHKRFFRYLWY